MTPEERFHRWVQTDRGGNVALSVLACALVAFGYLLGRLR